MITDIVAELAVPSALEIDRWKSLERTMAAHDAEAAGVSALNTLELGGRPGQSGPLTFPSTVAAWNLERCLFPEPSADHIAATGACLVLLSEMDNGMARTGQRHTTQKLAAKLSMAYAYGVEFIELGLGSEIEASFASDAHNARGFHGNALAAAVTLSQPFMLRLWGERPWFTREGDQPRLGDRCAIGAVIATEMGPMLAVSVHLESATTAAYRERQVTDMLDRLEEAFPGLPLLIGGDLNTGNHAGGDFEAEGLFRRAEARGFLRHGGPLDAMTTRPSLITRWPDRAMKLDWFLSRGLAISETTIVPSLDAGGRPLSDHDMIVCRIEGFA
ncbi:Metal-dependent hydrolase, endonuclease/exonuclease/phosphatase family [Rhizobium sp. RU20A]|uniref:endonuclease/exonuclease/phosphatase family protein n=1 Tax=Rhizobium sp. RU20A TaxID=1907412 RepID=UPI00095564C1|nr:endonuclease [Rhizobium sp. RU20A]SIQ72410.1 Metal-dependent hydrolase, endonuclease/exonuclease/phosphatase family [Rhizobium sp. RU20A]